MTVARWVWDRVKKYRSRAVVMVDDEGIVRVWNERTKHRSEVAPHWVVGTYTTKATVAEILDDISERLKEIRESV